MSGQLMNALLARNMLHRNDIEYHLAYTAMIFEFASKYEWENILEYDYHYRELQAAVITPVITPVRASSPKIRALCIRTGRPLSVQQSHAESS